MILFDKLSVTDAWRNPGAQAEYIWLGLNHDLH